MRRRTREQLGHPARKTLSAKQITQRQLAGEFAGPLPRVVRDHFRLLLEAYGYPVLLRVLTTTEATVDQQLRAVELLARFGSVAASPLAPDGEEVPQHLLGVLVLPPLDSTAGAMVQQEVSEIAGLYSAEPASGTVHPPAQAPASSHRRHQHPASPLSRAEAIPATVEGTTPTRTPPAHAPPQQAPSVPSVPSVPSGFGTRVG